MKKRRIVLGVMGILLLGAWLARVIWFNSTYPDVTRMTYSMGEMVALEKDVIDYSSMEGYEVQVENAKIWEYEDFVEYYQVSEEIRNEVEVIDPMGAPERVYDIEITLKMWAVQAARQMELPSWIGGCRRTLPGAADNA